jgi:hypothetical protein
MYEIDRRIDLIEWAKRISLLKDPYTKTGELINIGFFISESTRVKDNPVEIEQVVTILLQSALQEQDDALRSDIFSAIAEILYSSDMGALDIEWKPLVSRIPIMNKDDLGFALLFLGYSVKEEYLPLIESYMTYSDPFVQLQAIDAISEIRSALTNKDPKVKEWSKEKKKQVREQYPGIKIYIPD